MKAEDYINKWCDETYKGGKELGDWTTAEVMKFANDFINNCSFIEQDIQKLCDDCCDDYTVDINNQYIGKVFQWLISNDYVIYKKIGG